MARAKNGGNGRLEEALATLIQNQAAFVAEMRETDRRLAEMERINSERFARIEAMHLEHTHILAEHGRILGELMCKIDALAEKVGERIVFRVGEPSGVGRREWGDLFDIPSAQRSEVRGQRSEVRGEW